MRRVETALGRFLCYDDQVGSALESGQFWDQQIQPAIDDADPHGWAIDIGANIGWFTVYMAKRFLGVIALEPHPNTFAVLAENLVENGVLSRTRPYLLAAFDHQTWLTLASAEWLGWTVGNPATLEGCPHPASIAFVEDTAGRLPAGSFQVPATPVDVLVPPGERVTLIKVDAQGCDLRALKGLEWTISTWHPRVIFEYEGAPSHWHGDYLEDYQRFFTGLGYEVTRIREDLWDFTATWRGL